MGGTGTGKRKVLIVSYYFPPSGGPGVQRVLKLTRYLPECGWEPLVLTVPEDAEFPVLDPTLRAEIPAGTKVFRSGIAEFYEIYRRITGKRGERSVDIQTVLREEPGWRDRLVRWIRGSVFIPDGRVGWLRPGVRLGEQVLREEEPDAIFASGPPFTTHWIGKKLAERSGRPLVLDFRDPWTRATFYPVRPGWARRLDERLEESCLRAAAAVVTVNREMRDDLLARHPFLAGRLAVVPNGFDPADFEALPGAPRRKGTIAHVGSLFASRIPWTFLEVLETWLREEPRGREGFRLVLAGRVAPEMQARIAGSPALAGAIEDRGYVSHRESIEIMCRSDLLLLLTGTGETSAGMITGKLYEYLGSGSEILALAPPGEAGELIERVRAGVVFHPDDAEGIRAFLRGWWDRGLERPARDEGAIRTFSRREQASQIARTLERICDEAGDRPRPPRSAGRSADESG